MRAVIVQRLQLYSHRFHNISFFFPFFFFLLHKPEHGASEFDIAAPLKRMHEEKLSSYIFTEFNIIFFLPSSVTWTPLPTQILLLLVFTTAGIHIAALLPPSGHLSRLSIHSSFTIPVQARNEQASFLPPFSPPSTLPSFLGASVTGFLSPLHCLHVKNTCCAASSLWQCSLRPLGCFPPQCKVYSLSCSRDA